MRHTQDIDDDVTELGYGGALAMGVLAAAIAIIFRVGIGPRISGEQAIFTYPAIIIVTLLGGRRAGAITATICLLALWYYVVPFRRSFMIASIPDAVALFVYISVAVAFVFFLGKLRILFYRYRKLAFLLERRVSELTAERSRMWEHVNELTVIVATDGAIEAANPAFQARVGRTMFELEQANIREFIAETDWRNFSRARRELLGGETSASFTTTFTSQAETVTIVWSMTQDGRMFYLVGRR